MAIYFSLGGKIMNPTVNDENSLKNVKIGMKYQNINSDIRKKQKNRFRSLFPIVKEMFMYLILRALNTYCLYVLPNIPLYYRDGSKLKNDLLNLIFDENYFYSLGYIPNIQNAPEQTYQPEPYMQFEQDIQFEQDVLSFFNDDEDELEVTTGLYEADLPASDNISQNSSQEALLRFFFDLHFGRNGESVLFKCYNEYDNFQFFITDLNFYNAALQKQSLDTFNFKTLAVTPDVLNFIDEIMAEAIKRPLFKGINFWSNYRRTLFHNYILNFNICGFFQSNQYRECLIRFGLVLCKA